MCKIKQVKKYRVIIMNKTELEQKLFDLRMQLAATKAQIKFVKTELWERKADEVYKLASQQTQLPQEPEEPEQSNKQETHTHPSNSSRTTLLSELDKIKNSEQGNVKLFKSSYGIPYNTCIDSMVEDYDENNDEYFKGIDF